MTDKLNLDPDKAKKVGQKEIKEEDVAVILVELLQNCGILLAQIAESQAIIADCSKKQLEMDIEFAQEEAEEAEDDDVIEGEIT